MLGQTGIALQAPHRPLRGIRSLAGALLLGAFLAACEISDITPPPEPPPTGTPPKPTALALALPLATRSAPLPQASPTVEASFLAVSGDASPLGVLELPEGVGAVVFSDTFDANAGWGEGPEDYGSIAISTGMLNINVSTPHRFMITRWNQPPVENAYFEVTARPGLCSGRDEYALLYNLLDLDNYYRFSLACDGRFQVAKTVGGTSQPLKDWVPTAAYTPGAPGESRIGVWTRDGRMRFFINGIPVLELSDSTFAGGRVGLFVRSADSGNTSVSFDDLAIRELTP